VGIYFWSSVFVIRRLLALATLLYNGYNDRYVKLTEHTGKINPLMGTLKPQSNGPLLVHWPLVHQGGAWASCGPAQSPRCTK